MSAWKVVVIGFLACVCLALGSATVAIPIAEQGGARWVWLGGLFAGTAVAAVALILFLRYASQTMDVKPRWAKR